ncbi:MAG: hypothetical protein JST65_01865 [Acidobacteria bacterium]|nr:hypothetical protein [Acidobacteriota bacterium]
MPSRIPALLLLLLNSLLLTVPVAIAANTKAPEIPACCRRDGKHKCGMAKASAAIAAIAENGGLAMVSGQCPCCPKGSVQASLSITGVAVSPGLAVRFAMPVFAQETGLAQTDARRRMAEHRAWQKRGPPTSTSNS